MFVFRKLVIVYFGDDVRKWNFERGSSLVKQKDIVGLLAHSEVVRNQSRRQFSQLRVALVSSALFGVAHGEDDWLSCLLQVGRRAGHVLGT